MTEQWLPVIGYEGLYEVSSTGRVRSLDREVNHWRGGKRLVKGRELAAFEGNKKRERGYLRVGLYKRAQLRSHHVHTLVLEAFVGPRPDGMVCCHRNGVSTDNRLENLRWDTISANALDDVRNGVHPTGSKTHCKRGHEFTTENTILRGPNKVYRACRECANASRRRRHVPAASRRIGRQARGEMTV